MTEPRQVPPRLRDEPCHCSRPDLPHEHKLGDHKPDATDLRRADRPGVK